MFTQAQIVPGTRRKLSTPSEEYKALDTQDVPATINELFLLNLPVKRRKISILSSNDGGIGCYPYAFRQAQSKCEISDFVPVSDDEDNDGAEEEVRKKIEGETPCEKKPKSLPLGKPLLPPPRLPNAKDALKLT